MEDEYEQAKTFYKALGKLIQNLKVISTAGIKVDGLPDKAQLDEIIEKYNGISINKNDFNPSDLTELYEPLREFFENDTNIGNLMDEVDLASKQISENTNLTDAQFAKKLIAARLDEDMPLERKGKVASAVLAKGVMDLQTDKSYETLAREGSAEVLNVMQQSGFKAKLIDFKYKEGDKEVQPFKGMKPENFQDWKSIEKLFEINKLNENTGFLLLAAFQEFDQGVPSIQAVRIERKLKELIAKKLGVEERLDEAGISKIVDKAFNDQLDGVKPLIGAFFNHYDENQQDWTNYKVKDLNKRFDVLKEQLKTQKITVKLYKKKLEDLLEEAEESQVEDRVKFSQSSIMASYWNSPAAQWMKDLSYDVGSLGLRKTLSVGKAGFWLGMRGAWGTTKLGLSLGYQSAMAPFRIAKYPLMVAAKPLVGIVNLFRRNKWKPIGGIRETLKKDKDRIMGYVKEKPKSMYTGAKDSVKKDFSREWGKEKWKRQKYKERTKKSVEQMQAEAKEYAEKGNISPVEIGSSPFVDFDKYKKEITQLDKIVKGGNPDATAAAA